MLGITIKDVAKKANVSVATVSRVLNNSDKVKPETAIKVNKAIEECNYYANSFARSLKNSKSHIIGVVVSDISNSYFSNGSCAYNDIRM